MIRDAVGFDFDLMLEGHGCWSTAVAIEIARALEPVRLRWAEDLTLANSARDVRVLRQATRNPIVASEYLATRWAYLPFLEHEACDYVMLDPAWCGGISEAIKIIELAAEFDVPATIHDATGPFTLLAGIQLAAALPSVLYQEVVRPFLRTIYPEIAHFTTRVAQGTITLPEGAGLGGALIPAVRDGGRVRVTRPQDLP